jgi:hypothetical protein
VTGGMGALNQIISLLSAGAYVLLGVALVVIGLVQVRRAHAMAGLALAGAGASLAFLTLAQQIVFFLANLTGPSVFVAMRIVSLLGAFVEGGLAALAIFLLSSRLQEGRS